MIQHTAAPTWVGLGLLAVLAIGLAGLALVVIVTVLVASGGSHSFNRQIKSALLVMLLVAPALAVVAFIGVGYTSLRTVDQSSAGTSATNVRDDQSSSRDRQSTRRVERTTRPAHFDLRAAPQDSTQAEVIPVSLRDEPTTASPENSLPAEANGEAAPSGAPAAPSAPAAPAAAGPGRPTINNQDAALALGGLDGYRAAAGVLRVRETLPREPEWAKSGALPGDSGVLVPLSSQRFATLTEAEEQVTQLATGYIRNFYRDEYPLEGDWSVPVNLIEKHAVKALVGEELEKDFGNGIKGKMYRAHLQLDLNSKLRQGLHESWRDQIVKHRLTMLGTGLGMVTVMLAASAGYFRLNEMTHGQYRGRLKLAAVALIGAAGLGALAVV
ncbi:MAG: hypothetical protein HY290_28605 [Planctomycetia bacterium]|nr:hypothetical protein [Planctomycetia bacterium]